MEAKEMITSEECAILFQKYAKTYKGTKTKPAFCWEFMRDYLLPAQIEKVREAGRLSMAKEIVEYVNENTTFDSLDSRAKWLAGVKEWLEEKK